MQLIATRLGPGDRHDRLRCVRADGSASECTMPRQGALPHDLIHLVVESALGFDNGFLGLVARGADIDFAGKQFHEYIDPERHAQVAQAESVVEALQAQLWAGAFDADAFAYGVEMACAMRKVPMPVLSRCDARTALFDRVVALGRAWNGLPSRAQWTLSFPLDPAFAPAQAA
jgi:hypothetical protein